MSFVSRANGLIKLVKRSNLEKITYKKLYSTTMDSNKPNDNLTNPFEKERKKCILCEMNITPNYKNVKLLSQFQSSFTGRIYGRHITGLCSHKQRQVEAEIVKAQHAGLMGYYNKNIAFMRDVKLFDADKPIKSHRFE